MSARLTTYLASLDNRPFDWASFNCCHFAAGWVESVTGRNPMAELDVTPDLRSARRLIQSLGGTLADAWTKQLGREPLATPNLAQVGDVVLLKLPGDAGNAVGICAGGVVAVATTEGAIAFTPMADATHAWRIEPCRA